MMSRPLIERRLSFNDNPESESRVSLLDTITSSPSYAPRRSGMRPYRASMSSSMYSAQDATDSSAIFGNPPSTLSSAVTLRPNRDYSTRPSASSSQRASMYASSSLYSTDSTGSSSTARYRSSLVSDDSSTSVTLGRSARSRVSSTDLGKESFASILDSAMYSPLAGRDSTSSSSTSGYRRDRLYTGKTPTSTNTTKLTDSVIGELLADKMLDDMNKRPSRIPRLSMTTSIVEDVGGIEPYRSRLTHNSTSVDSGIGPSTANTPTTPLNVINTDVDPPTERKYYSDYLNRRRANEQSLKDRFNEPVVTASETDVGSSTLLDAVKFVKKLDDKTDHKSELAKTEKTVVPQKKFYSEYLNRRYAQMQEAAAAETSDVLVSKIQSPTVDQPPSISEITASVELPPLAKSSTNTAKRPVTSTSSSTASISTSTASTSTSTSTSTASTSTKNSAAKSEYASLLSTASKRRSREILGSAAGDSFEKRKLSTESTKPVSGNLSSERKPSAVAVSADKSKNLTSLSRLTAGSSSSSTTAGTSNHKLTTTRRKSTDSSATDDTVTSTNLPSSRVGQISTDVLLDKPPIPVIPRRRRSLLSLHSTSKTDIPDISEEIRLETEEEEVNGLSDFFKESDVFIAYGTERMSIDDFYIDTEEHKFLFSTRMRPNSLTRGSSANSNGRILRRFNRDLDDRDHPSPLFRRRFLNHRNQKLKTGMKVHKSKGAPITSAEDSKTASSTDCSVMSPNDVCQPMADSTNHVHERRSRDRGHATVNNENDCDMHASTSHDRPELKHIDSMCSDIDYMPSTCNASASTSHPAFITDKYDIGRMVGDGNFAMVYACTSKSKGDPVAMKVIDKSKCEGKQDLIENEMALLRRLDHEHVVKLYDVWEMPDSYYFVMELVPEGDLFEALITVRCYDEPVAAQLSRDMCDALQYLHSLHIVHRDVKPENLLLYTSSDGRKKLKLADFGLAIEVNEPLMTVCGTPTYVAPEILAEVGYGCKVDIWAAGCITYIMLCGFPPFFSLQNNQEELFDLIVAGRFTFPSPYWDAISNAAKGLIQGMLQLDGDDRYSASEVLIHPWITTEACVSADYERMCRAQIESSFQHISQHDRLSETRSSHSFYDGDNVEFYYSRRRSMDDFSVLSASEDDEQMHDQPVKQSAVRFATNNNNHS